MTRRHVPSSWTDITAWATFMKGGAPVWFHQSHIVNTPWLFEMLYNVAKPLLNERAYGNTIMHKKQVQSYLILLSRQCCYCCMIKCG